MRKLLNKIIDIHNAKVNKEIDNYKFLKSLCISNGVLDLNKYTRLLKMVKKKYK